MSHTVHPYAHRLGIIRDWKSRWFGDALQYRQFLKSDILLREYLTKRLRGLSVDSVHIERGENFFRLIIKTSRPGLVIGRAGESMTKLRADITKFLDRNIYKPRAHGEVAPQKPKEFRIDVEEVKSPETSAAIVAGMVAEGLERRLPFRRVLKQTVEKVMANREVKGVKIGLTGRLGGAEMAREEELKKGGIPLQTFRADIDFAREKAHLPYGDLGIKVWIYKGQVFAEKVTTKTNTRTN